MSLRHIPAAMLIAALSASVLSILAVPQKADPTPSATLIPAETPTRQARF